MNKYFVIICFLFFKFNLYSQILVDFSDYSHRSVYKDWQSYSIGDYKSSTLTGEKHIKIYDNPTTIEIEGKIYRFKDPVLHEKKMGYEQISLLGSDNENITLGYSTDGNLFIIHLINLLNNGNVEINSYTFGKRSEVFNKIKQKILK